MRTLALAQVSQEELRHEILHTWEVGKDAWEIPIELFGVDISINKPVWFLFIGVAITFLFLFIGSRLLKDRPGAYQVIVEEIYGFGRNFLGGQVGPEGMKWFPYTLSLFVLLLVLNLIGLLPTSYPVTGNIAFTMTLALITFGITQYVGVRKNGLFGYVRNWTPPGVPKLMAPVLWFLHLVQEISKPLTLGLRLYANILAGHLIIFVFLGLILYFGAAVAIVSVPFAVVFFAFEVFVCVLQAYIFAILTQIYIEQAIYIKEH